MGEALPAWCVNESVLLVEAFEFLEGESCFLGLSFLQFLARMSFEGFTGGLLQSILPHDHHLEHT